MIRIHRAVMTEPERDALIRLSRLILSQQSQNLDTSTDAASLAVLVLRILQEDPKP